MTRESGGTFGRWAGSGLVVLALLASFLMVPAQPAQAAQSICTPPTPNLVSWWPGDGNANDIAGSNNGTLKNGATFASGKVGQAFSFDGVDDYVDAGTSVGNFGTSDFTIDLWMKRGAAVDEPLIVKRPSNIQILSLGVRSTGELVPELRGTQNDYVAFDTSPIITDLNWHHVALVRLGSVVEVYVDGVLAKSQDFGIVSILSSEAPFTIGAGLLYSQFYTGLIDEVELYNRALSTAEIQAIFNAGSAGKCKPQPPSVDTTPPVISPVVTGTQGDNGWFVSDVGVAWSVTDAESAISARIGCNTATLTTDTLGTTFTCTATSAGGTALKSVTVKIDKTPPEAVNQFDPKTLDLAVSGRDGLSGVKSVTLVSTAPAPKKGPVGGEKAVRRTYVITDNAGNATTLVEDVRKAGHELKATKVSIQYGSHAAITFPENELRFEWALDKTGALKELEQEIEIGKGEARQEVEAKFEAKKGTTTIRVERPERETKTVHAGLVKLKLATANGELKIEQ